MTHPFQGPNIYFHNEVVFTLVSDFEVLSWGGWDLLKEDFLDLMIAWCISPLVTKLWLQKFQTKLA